MLQALFLLLLFQYVGDWSVKSLGLMLPGPVLGMLLFLVALRLLPRLESLTEDLIGFFNSNLALFYVPASVGVIAYLGFLAQNILAFFLIFVVSTAITLGVTAWVFAMLMARYKGESHE